MFQLKTTVDSNEHFTEEKVKNDSGAINFAVNYVEQFVIGH